MQMKPTVFGLLLITGFGRLLICLSFSASAVAQIVPDATLPVNSTVTPNCSNCTINGGSVRGGNLFHSFSQFSIPTGGSAYFNNAINIQSIISRVTGSNASTIDGLIRANGAANLIFINPNGIIFGPNARLNIGGSFLASTAQSVRFADGVEFSATNPQTAPLLTSSIPIGLGFLNPGPVQVRGQGHSLIGPTFLTPPIGLGTNPGLTVRPGRTLAIIGGLVTLDGGVLNVPSGHVEIAGVGNGTVSLVPSLTGWRFNYGQTQTFNDLLITNRSLADTTGLGSNSINLQGRNIRLDRGSVLIGFNTGTIPSGASTLNATESIIVSGTDPIARIPGGIFNATAGRAPGGSIQISSPNLKLEAGGLIVTETFGVNPAGNIQIQVPGTFQVDGASPRDRRVQSTLVSLSLGEGRAGDVQIDTGTLRITNGGFLESATYGRGEGGDVSVNATTAVELSGVARPFLQPSLLGSSTLGTGNAGSVTIKTPTLTVLNGGRLDSSTQSSGAAGSVLVTANRSVTVSGAVPESRNPSLISSAAAIVDPSLQQLFGLPRIPTGAAGSVTINTPQLTVQNDGQVSVRNEGVGDAGSLTINAQRVRVLSNGAITAQTNRGQGGDIQITSRTLILREGGSIVAAVSGAGDGGNITIDSSLIALLEGSRISANANQGTGGRIFITAQGVFLSPDSSITATSALGPQFSGIIQINTPDIDLSRSGVQTVPPPAVPEVAVTCGGGSTANANSFTISGTGGIPINPDEFLGSQGGWRDPAQSQSQSSSKPSGSPQAIVEAQGWERTSANTVRFAVVPNVVGSYQSNAFTGCIERQHQK